jgi:hypothetical protein
MHCAVRSVRWALSNIELYTPTGAPQTAAGRAALTQSAAKPTLRHNTPLSARHRAAAAQRPQAQHGTPRAGGGGGGGGSGARGAQQQQQRTPQSHGGGGGGGGRATPGSAPRPRAVDFF